MYNRFIHTIGYECRRFEHLSIQYHAECLVDGANKKRKKNTMKLSMKRSRVNNLLYSEGTEAINRFPIYNRL